MALSRSRHRSLAEFVPGTPIPGGYQIVRRIAKGGMSWVFEGTHAESGRRVAIKILHDSHRRERSLTRRFANEARAAMQLRSPHVVVIEAVGELDIGVPYIVMEFLEGADLYHVLRDAGWRLPVETTLYVIDQVIDALEVAHARGIIHRDIKPENVYLLSAPDGLLVKVVDFGLSHLPHDASHSGLTKTGTTVGTPQYMPVEQLRGTKDLDARVDVYAIGVLIYELLSGRCPYEGNDARDVMLRAAKGPPPPLSTHRPDLSPGLLVAVDAAMARNREDRCPSVSALRELLRPHWSGTRPDFNQRQDHDPSSMSEPATLRKAIAKRTAGGIVPVGPPVATVVKLASEQAEDSSPPVAPSSLQRHAPTRPNAGLVIAAAIAIIVLAIGITCMVVDTMRGTRANPRAPELGASRP
jgi:serine/threonine-protein kinase